MRICHQQTIWCWKKSFSEVFKVRLNDVLTDYQIADNLLEYQTMDGKRYQHKVVK